MAVFYDQNNGAYKMAVKSDFFGRTELSGESAKRFIRHMEEDAPNDKAKAAYVRGKALFSQIQQGHLARPVQN